jgi:NAD-dependent dihydropyrimidine dehydrogenase PreA subunit
MKNDIYRQLAQVLDTLPNGFPSTEAGIEIQLLKKIFDPDEAELFCDLKLHLETAQQIAERTGRPLEGLEEKLTTMWKKGQVFGVELGGTKLFRMVPWVFGIYELQLNRMDREFAELAEQYMYVYGQQFFQHKPQLMQVIPVEKEIPNRQEALPYEQVSAIIERGKSFAVAQCICKKEKALLDDPCDKPQEICMAIAPVEGIFERGHWGRPISKEEAYRVLQIAEEAALVHMTYNIESGHFFICNCCGCCCGILRAINEMGIKDATNSHYYAEIDPDKCVACGTCKDDRCQVNAIEEGEYSYSVLRETCIGCGLCASTCPSEAIRLLRKPAEEIVPPPRDEKDWYRKRAEARGVDYEVYE